MDAFLKLSDGDVRHLSRPLESAKDTKIRLMYAYNRYITELVDLASPVASSRGRVVKKTGNSLADFVLENYLKFTNIGLSAWYNLLRAHSMAAGINPNGVNGWWGNASQLAKIAHAKPQVAAKMATGLFMGQQMMQWGYDLKEGKTPQTHPTCLLYTSPSPRDS